MGVAQGVGSVGEVMDLTKEERKAIAGLERVAKIWPGSLWLFSAGGDLHVMRAGENGEQVENPGGGMDQDYIVTGIAIPNDGGDW